MTTRWVVGMTTLVVTSIVGSGCGNDADEMMLGADEWELVEDLRIGSLDSSGPDQFGYVADIHVDGRNRLWVVDGPTQEIRIFDAAGRWVRTVGRSGAGPGEFGTAGGLETGPNGNVWVSDGRNVRWTVLDSAGAYVSTHPRAAGTYRFGDRWGPDGLLYTWVVRRGGFSPDFVLVRRSLRDGHLVAVDTIPVPHADPGRTSALSFVRNGRRMTMQVPTPFQSVRKRALIPGSGWWVSHPGPSYRLARIDLWGDTVAVLEAPWVRVPVTERDLEFAAQAISPDGRIGTDDVPEHHPPVEELIALTDGRVLARRRAPSGEVFDLVSPEARLLATVANPLGPRLEVRTTSADAVYGVVQDDLGVPYVVRLRLRRTTR